MVEVELLQTKIILSNFLIYIFRAIFHPMSDYAVRDSSLVKRIIQIQAFFSMKGPGILAGSSPDSQPQTTKTAIFVKSHLKK